MVWTLVFSGVVTFTGGCASFNPLKAVGDFVSPRFIEIRSTPEGATVSSRTGEKLGVTPLKLQGDSLERNIEKNRLLVVLSHPGWVSRELWLDVSGGDVHDISLTQSNAAYFSEKVLTEYSPEINQLIRDLLQIQGMLILKKWDDAERALKETERRFPGVASIYVMLANIEEVRGNRQQAMSYLWRARSIDPQDPVVNRRIGVRAPSGGQQ